MLLYLLYMLVGVAAGIGSGLFGIGGGIVIVPMLVFLTKVSQHNAVATSLVALLLPVGCIAVYEYYVAGKLSKPDMGHGALIALGMLAGAALGARLGLSLSEVTLRRLFAGFLMLVAIRMFVQA